MTQKVTTVLDDLNLTDRFLFDETMEEPEAYQATVSILLENEVEFLGRPETQQVLSGAAGYLPVGTGVC